MLDNVKRLLGQLCRVLAHLLHQLRHHAVALAEQGVEKMLDVDRRVVVLLGQRLSLDDSVLSLLCKLQVLHDDSSIKVESIIVKPGYLMAASA